MRGLTALLFLLIGLCAVTSARAAQKPPNVVVLLIDDMGWGDFSCFGNPEATTPNIDRLAAEGIRFSQFYVNAPICSPSRCALTTGQYPHRWNIFSYLDNRATNEKRGVAQWLDLKAPVLARFLKQGGYATGHFGKWHLGGQRDVGEAPLITEYGFDESLTNFEGLGPRLLGLCDAHDGKPPRPQALGSDKLGRGPIIWYDRSQLTTGYAGAAMQFMDKAVADSRPFYVNLWPDDVHGPWYPPEKKRGDGSKHSLYLGVLEAMDAQLGPFFEHLRSTPALRDNTLLIVFSDNGPEPGAGSAGPLRGTKGTVFEGGVRSPLIVWGPGFIPKEKVGLHNESSVLFEMDLVPSILRFTNQQPPAGVTFDGEVVTDTLLGKSTASRTTPLFWRRPPGTTPHPDLAVREGNWKFLCEYEGENPQLYDLAHDQTESKNVAEQNPEVAKRLKEKVLAWHKSMPQDKGPELVDSPPKRVQRDK